MILAKQTVILRPMQKPMILDRCDIPFKYCEFCDLYYLPHRKNQEYHKNACRQMAYRIRLLERKGE